MCSLTVSYINGCWRSLL